MPKLRHIAQTIGWSNQIKGMCGFVGDYDAFGTIAEASCKKCKALFDKETDEIMEKIGA